VLWDDALPGFGLKVTPRGKKVFIVLYRTGGAGSALRKYTIGPYGRVTLHAARAEAQKILAARLEGRDPAAEKQHKRKKLIADQVSDVVEAYVRQHVSQRRSARDRAPAHPRPAFPRCARCRVRCEPDFAILYKGIVGSSGAGDGWCGG
jgi:hypothetical protein